MPKFNPKNHDLTRGEAKFLSELSKLSTKDIKTQIEKSAKEISQTKTEIAKARAIIDKKISSALSEAQKAAKTHADLKKKLAQVDALFWMIDKAPPSVGNAVAKKLERLNQDVGKCQAKIDTSLTKATADIVAAGKAYNPYVTWMGPSLNLVPSQPKVLVLTP